MSLDVDCDVCRLRLQLPARVLTATALLGAAVVVARVTTLCGFVVVGSAVWAAVVSRSMSASLTLLGTRRVVLPNSVLHFTHCRIVLIVRCRSYQELENLRIVSPAS
jgi:hypothetical protein